MKRYEKHIFSPEHIDNVVMSSGDSKSEIMNKFVRIIKELDTPGNFVEGSNQIHTIINGQQAEIKIFLKNGEVISIDGFKGWSTRIINKVIHYLP